MPMLKCPITKLADTIWPLVAADIPVCIYGPTGVGKSSIIKNDLMPKVEMEFGPSVLHDVRLSTKDITDGTGMPVIDKGEMSTEWTRPAFIPKDDGRMHVNFYDEFGHCSVHLQQMAYSIVLDRALGGYNMPKNNRIILATNTRPDGGGDNKMLKPLENRLAHVLVEPDHNGFIEKTKEWGWDKRLIVFLNTRPELIHKVDDANAAFPTPRSLEQLNKILKHLGPNAAKTVLTNVSHAIVGEGFTRQFMQFIDNMTANLPRWDDIVKQPEKAALPQDAYYQQVVASSIAARIDAKTAPQVAVYLSRMMEECRNLALHEAVRRDPGLSKVKALEALLAEANS